MPIQKSLLIDLGILFALVLIGAAGYWFSPLLLPKSDVVAAVDPACDLQRQACAATLPDGSRIELSMSPRPIPVLQPLAIEVRVSGLAVRQAVIDFAGVGMDMGYNRPSLTAAGPGRFTGTASLPVCVTGAMPWQATVLLDTDHQHIAASFRFVSSPH